MIKSDLKKYQKQLKAYSELRLQENSDIFYMMMNGSLVKNESTTTSGVSARVYLNGYFGFASSPVISDEAILNVINKAEKNAEFLSNKSDAKKEPFKAEVADMKKDFSTIKDKWTEEMLIDYLKEVDTYIDSKYPDLVSRTIVLKSLNMKKNLITSDGSNSYLNWPRTVIYIALTTSKDDEPCEMYEAFGGRGNFEDLFENPEDMFSDIDKLHNELMNKNAGVTPTAGYHDVILDADLAGILAHEALGHTVEADLVRNGSIAGDYMDKKVASELITLVDFAHSYNNEILPVPIFIDDEGCRSEDAVIIEDGILRSFMHNKDSAQAFNMKNTGNARAWQYSDEPLIRMRNTCIIPGKSKLDEMIASIEDGYYFTKTNNGQADTTGEFMFGVSAGYEIKKGKLGKAIKNTTISGRAFDVLLSVTMVSDDMKWNAGGMCGKKQPIPTGMGGPAIKCKINVGGK